MHDTLLAVLGAERGLVCCVGAGGKKSTLYRLAARHPGRVGITATAHIEYFPRPWAAACVIAEPPELVPQVSALAARERVVAFARPCNLPGRHLGVSLAELAAIRAACGFDLCVVKADGARNRILKAPAPHEPALPLAPDTIITCCSVRAIGQSLNEKLAHRPALIAALTGLDLEATVEPEHLGRLLANPEGALRGVGSARVVPLINMVDDAELERLAVRVAETALALTDRFEYVVLAAMRNSEPIVRVVRRIRRTLQN